MKEAFSSRDAAIAGLRSWFAQVYELLLARGHSVLVRFDDPANPACIPQLLEVDGLGERWFNVRFAVESTASYTRQSFHYGVWYNPSHESRRAWQLKEATRNFKRTPNRMSPTDTVDWLEKYLDHEKRAMKIADERTLEFKRREERRKRLDEVVRQHKAEVPSGSWVAVSQNDREELTVCVNVSPNDLSKVLAAVRSVMGSAA